jgi:hypothetical protein
MGARALVCMLGPAVVLAAGCRENTTPSRVDAALPTKVDLPQCARALVDAPVPPKYASLPLSATSGEPVVIDSWTIDHYSGGMYEVPLGPFMVRYEQDPRQQCHNPQIREAGCDGAVLRADGYWLCNQLRLRRDGDTFVITSIPSGEHDELPLVAFRRGG